MYLFGNFFGCCNRYNKEYKKSDIEIKKVQCENDNMATYLLSEKNTQINHNTNNSFLNNFSKINRFDFNNSKNDNEDDRKSATFQKNSQNISNDYNFNINIDDKKGNSNIVLKIPDLKNTIISIADISFFSEKNSKQEDSFSKLLLTGDLFFGKEIIITETGMLNSKRNKKDGFTFFGLKNTKDISGQLNNDFIINFTKNMDEFENIDTESGKVFEIIFNKKYKDYSLYFLNPYLYLYYKINNFVYFFPQRDYFLFVGKIFLSINVEKINNEQIINIQVDNTYENQEESKEQDKEGNIEGNKEEANKKYSFSQKKNVIKIGRVNCDINISEKCISKIHGIIEFSKNNQQFYYKDMNSTNGTTLLIKKDDFLKIKGEMNFKLEDVTFKIQEIP